ncbi:pyroglutamyl-peptidase I (C15 family) [Novymonas esmeraldas]|uniref:Pyroglutamyl-peptidase I (C15 family) n=1 Tax=Novymonas esmeraldas TaxID=1808958 RepID=A0AAW0F6K7_9TRYP
MTDAKTGCIVFLTGYGPFANVKVNPSSAIAVRLVEDLQRHPSVAEVRYTELDVSVRAVAAYFAQVERDIAQILAERGGADKVKILLCHLGVHTDTTGLIRAEVQGYNELFSSVPDVDGTVLNHEPIEPEDGTAEVYHESWFGKAGTPQLEKLQELIQQLNDAITASPAHPATGAAAPHQMTTADSNSKEMVMPTFQAPSWTISRDAGRYLCNCALYRALRLQEKNPGTVYGIFIHVVNPVRGKTETDDGPIVAYNPTVMVQSEQLKNLLRGLLPMMLA